MTSYCRNCGIIIKNTDKFCKRCGAKNVEYSHPNQEKRSPSPTNTDSRSQLLIRLQRALDTIRKIEAAQVALESIQKEISVAEERRVPKLSLIAFFAAVCLGISIISIAFEDPEPGSILVAAIFLFLTFLVYRLLNAILLPRAKRKAEKAYQDNMPSLKMKETQCKNNLSNLCKTEEIERTLDVVPETYTSEPCLMFFIDVIKNCRADNLKEAINLYEAHLIKLREWELQCAQLEALLQANKISEEQAKIQRAQLQAQEAMFKNTKRTAKSARFNNVVSIINSVHHWND